ncbi:carboxypeptidase-like regulatory domain-containing protein [Dyadobacter sp. CY326]|uniref:carboxypeptidase-like regulatory domain-containing protein n=1 Tax=Dyadobacter sp. CY326 TaxID=2907300 RepID=UPI001F418C17|nr:carboxypeptidase-like regulatory domain-containing protein [Dyadobacter sp. CY326]MCE7065305.1 carboxypeptidase-like regulatory domain-containing protein [Dyadobacter sp. CY326]
MKGLSLLLQSIFILFIALACTETDGPEPDETAAVDGYATGKVTNTDGSPLAGVKIVIDNTMIHASYSLGNSDEKGNYKIQLPKVGTFMASAHITKQYNGKEYEFDLHPDVYEAFSIDGAVRNFQWKLTGKRPVEAQGYYGVTIEVNKAILSGIYDSENIEFTLVPVGNLIDGSKGKTLKMKHGQPFTNDYGKLVDIPLGRYKMTAYYKGEAGEGPLKLRKHFSEDAYEDEIIIDFEPSTMWGNNIAFISYTE